MNQDFTKKKTHPLAQKLNTHHPSGTENVNVIRLSGHLNAL